MDSETLKKKALKKDPNAHVALGKYYLTTPSESDHLLHAEKWFKKAASNHHPEGLYQLALMKIDHGDLALASTLLTRAIKRKYPLAFKTLGTLYRGDYSFEYRNTLEAAKLFHAYYKVDPIDALEPLLSVYHAAKFSQKDAEHFLTKADSYGLSKARYHLAMLKLNQKATQSEGKAMLEEYYHASGDVNAAKTLYEIYDPNEPTYTFSEKDPALARHYLRACIEGNGTLEGSEYFETIDVWLPQLTENVEVLIDKNLKRMKTSLAIDETFGHTVSLDDFSLRLNLEIETIFDYQATFTYDTRHIEKTIIEKEVMKKQAVRKGFKKTGTVKVPKRVSKTKKRKHYEPESKTLTQEIIAQKKPQLTKITSIKALAEQLSSYDIIFHFAKPPSASVCQERVEKIVKKAFKKPRHSKHVNHTVKYETLYLLNPQLWVHYTYKKTRYACVLPLTEPTNKGIPFPLNKPAAKELNRFLFKQKALKRNHYFTSIFLGILFFFSGLVLYQTLLASVGFFATLNRYYIYPVLFVLLAMMIGYLSHKALPIKPLDKDDFLKHYDDSDIDTLTRAHRKNVGKIIIKSVAIFTLFLLIILLRTIF